MVNSSPEYSITKPGLHHLRKRDRPLRTYGRQPSAPSPQNEPPPKKLRLSALQQQQQQTQQEQEEERNSTSDSANDIPTPVATPISSSSETTKANDDAPNQTKPDTTRIPSSKASILSYFKPAPPPLKPKDETTQPLPQEPDDDEPFVPPASPPIRKPPSQKRKPRLLKIKPITHDEPLDEPSPEQQPNKTTTLAEAASSSSTSTNTTPSTSPRKTSLRNHQKPSPKRPSKSSSPAVQTTLNISARAAFSECKICDTVWNPLYPDDVKFHDKAHRAVLRAQRKRKMDEL